MEQQNFFLTGPAISAILFYSAVFVGEGNLPAGRMTGGDEFTMVAGLGLRNLRQQYESIFYKPDATHFETHNCCSLEYGHDFIVVSHVKDYDSKCMAIHLLDKRHTGVCPHCGEESSRANGYTRRYALGQPLNGWTVYLLIEGARFFCDNDGCKYRTFQLDIDFLPRFSRSTAQVEAYGLVLSILGSFESAADGMRKLKMVVSANCLNRRMRKTIVKFGRKPVVIAVDEVTKGDGVTFVTHIYEYFSHKLLMTYEGRDGEALQRFLEENPTVKVVLRDRSSSYSRAVEDSGMDICQVADHFHLIEDLIEYIDKAIKNHLPWDGIYLKRMTSDDGSIRYVILPRKPSLENRLPDYSSKYPPTIPNDCPPVDSNGGTIQINIDPTSFEKEAAERRAASKKKKADLIRRVREFAAGQDPVNYSRIADKYMISAPTVKRYLSMSPEEIDALTDPQTYLRSVPYDPAVNIIYKLIEKYHTINPVIFAYMKGFNLYHGDDKNLEVIISRIAVNHFGRKPFFVSDYKRPSLPEGVFHIPRRKLSRFICTLDPEKEKSKVIAEAWDVIVKKYPVAATSLKVITDFDKIFKQQDISLLNSFIEEFKENKDFVSFCNGLELDRKAVENAVRYSYLLNSGFAEGNNTAYKLIKRVTCGRCSVELIQCKFGLFLLRKDIDPYDVVRTRVCIIPDPDPDHPVFKLLEAM